MDEMPVPPVPVPCRASEVIYAQHIVDLEHTDGQWLLELSEEAGSSQYAHVVPYFELQETGAFCGLASITIVVNTILNEKRITQSFLWNLVLERILNGNKAEMRYGLSLQQVDTLFTMLNGAKSIKRQICDHSILKIQFQHDLDFVFQPQQQEQQQIHPTTTTSNNTPQNQNSKKHMIVINFWRDYKNHKGGHFSPIVAYSKKYSSVLIFDVSKQRGRPHWISIDILVLLMSKKDGNVPRGYLIMSFDLEEGGKKVEGDSDS